MAGSLEINQPAPAFSAPNANGETITLDDFAGKWLVLYFYPKDNTPGCTTEAIDFTQRLPAFTDLNAQVVGVSPDSEQSHCKFIEKHKLGVQLVSDSDHKIAEAYGAWGLKKFMGKEYEGIIRSTFLINPEGNIAHIWSNVRVKDHVDKILTKLKSML